ncbi:hypothetical protein [Candidatus Ruthia endofausta]|nr:hypothetical protein [Candidatus Ruthia endofausta]
MGKIISHNNTSHPLLIAILNDKKNWLIYECFVNEC